MSRRDEEFYEADEPLDKIVDAFERGEKRVTRAPELGQTAYLKVKGRLLGRGVPVTRPTTRSENKATKELISN
ncbi:hypothetical protein [Micromonospora maris]|uniref:Uncharacterized protein n=1 Tax=Micromonospora maris TaxID=1003110 RepID=A0A9X0LEQ6_9ACTN|nr:hypothetical protein [Micromonospora maris]AEB42046.1 hypothetical protein VAB18032_04600 [Micromonospora maris AB-18-032]KUJ47582.1 hypothetical protein ADL17_00105 [Micromonospora maris]